MVRHQVLVLAFGGSNPSTLANKNDDLLVVVFIEWDERSNPGRCVREAAACGHPSTNSAHGLPIIDYLLQSIDMKLPEIVGIAGTNGAGKDELGDLRFQREHARKVSLSDILRIEATKRGLSTVRENLRPISTEWGRQFGAGALSLMTLKEFEETRTPEEQGISIVSVRRPGEARVLQERGGLIVWVDAERELRYQRIQNAKREREEDMVSFEKFCADEDIEMYPASEDPFELNMAGVREMADVHIINEFDSPDLYHAFLTETFELPPADA